MIIAFSKTKGKVEPLDFHSHAYYEIYVFHGGNCHYIIDNHIINLVPGTILLMNGKSVHKAHVIQNESEYERSAVHFMRESIEKPAKLLGCTPLLEAFENKSVNIRRVNREEDLEKIAMIIEDLNHLSLLEETQAVKKETQLGIIKLLMFIDRVSKPTVTADSITDDVKKEYVEEIVLYLQNNYSQTITIDQIGKAMGLSPSYISRIFKEITGHTIMEYLMHYRFTQVKYLIEISRDKTFKEIASTCGFQSSAHFSRFIKEKTGMTPSVFKKTIQQKSYISPNSTK